MFRESLREIYTRPMGLTNDDLALAVLQISDLRGKTREELNPNIYIIVEVLHITIFADWGQTGWDTKVNHLKTYYEQCAAGDLSDLEVRLILELLDINMEEELIPSVDSLTTVSPVSGEVTPSSRPTIPMKH